MRTISIFGLGRVGLVTASCLAMKGNRVIGTDSDNHRVEEVKRASPPFFEPRLREYLTKTITNGSLTATQEASESSRASLVFITVGTPPKRDGSIDLSYVKSAARAIGKSLRNTDHNQLVVVKSTVPPGTAREVVQATIEQVSRKRAGRDFNICSNPEFLREGNAIHDTEFPDRIVIGSENYTAIRRLETVYREFHGEHLPPVIRTSHENAALIKYASNAFLATKVSFINCIADITARVPGADVKVVAAGIGLDKRIGPMFLNAGLGWGGSCFPKDLSTLIQLSKSFGYTPEMIRATVRTNRQQWREAIRLAEQALGSLKGRTVAILGLSFKPDTDDMRAAVSIPLIRALLAQNVKVVAYDPAATEAARRIFGRTIKFAKSPIQCITDADCCIVTTEWTQVRRMRPSDFVKHMRRPILVDGRRVFNPEKFLRAGVQFSAIGLGQKLGQP